MKPNEGSKQAPSRSSPPTVVGLAVAVGVALLAGAGALAGGAPLGDGDLFWQLAMGRWVLEHGALPTAGTDPFVLPPLLPDVHHEWLAQVGFASVERAAGLTALRGLGALFAALSVLAVFGAMRAVVAGPIAVALTALWWLMAEPHAVLRPHLLAWPLLVVGLAVALRRFDLRDGRSARRGAWLGWAALLVVWANLHASALAVPVYLAVLTLDAAAAAWIGPGFAGGDAPVFSWADVRRRGAGTITSVGIVALCQPAGVALLPYVAGTPGINRGLSTEWLPLLSADVWRSKPALIAGWGVIATGVAFASGSSLWRGGWRGAVGRQVPGLLGALLALGHAASTRRMTALLFVPLLFVARELPGLSGRSARSARAAVVALALVAAVVGAQASSLARSLRPHPLEGGAFPVEATAVLEAVEPEGPIVHPDAWGGFLSWRLGERIKVFADGRWPLVGRTRIEDGIAMIARREDPSPLFDRYGISWLLQPLGLYLQTAPPDPARWLLVWRDKTSVLLVRRDAAFDGNLERVCAFYAERDVLRIRATWPLRAQAADGVATPTDVPSVLEACAAVERGRRRAK